MAKNKELWHKSQLYVGIFIAIVVAVSNFGTNILFNWYNDIVEKDNINKTLKLAFRGEISSIKGTFQKRSLEAQGAVKIGKTLRTHRIRYPRYIYDASLRDIGKLKEADLAEKITELYSLAERVDNVGYLIDNGTYKENAIFEYAVNVAAVWRYAVMVYIMLISDEKNIEDNSYKIKDPAIKKEYEAAALVYSEMNKYLQKNVE